MGKDPNNPFYQVPSVLGHKPSVLGRKTYQPTDEADGTQAYYSYQGIGKTMDARQPIVKRDNILHVAAYVVHVTNDVIHS